MSKITLKIYDDDFNFDKDEIEYDQVEKIKKDNDWFDDNVEDIFDEMHKESHGYIEAVTLLENLINTITANDYIKADDDAWTIVFEAFNTLISRDTLGAYEKGLLEDWWVLQLDREIRDPEVPEVAINPMNLYYELEEEKDKNKVLSKERK